MKRLLLLLAVLLLVGCGAPPVPDAWVSATTLLVRPCVPSASAACPDIDTLPFAAGVWLAGEGRESRRHRCTEWARISYQVADEERHGWVCGAYLQPTPPTVDAIEDRVREHLATGQTDRLTNDVLMLAGLTSPSPFEAVLATGTVAAGQVRWAREVVVATDAEALALTDQEVPLDREDDAWIARAQGWAGLAAGRPLSEGPPVLWRRWSDPAGGGGFVLLQRASGGNLHRFAGAWTAASGGTMDVVIVARIWEKDALQRALERVPDHLRRDASPATWTGTDG